MAYKFDVIHRDVTGSPKTLLRILDEKGKTLLRTVTVNEYRSFIDNSIMDTASRLISLINIHGLNVLTK